MGECLVTAGKMDGDKIVSLDVELHGLGARTLDRDAAVAQMKDGHLFIPVIGGKRQPALLLLEVEDEHFIRSEGQYTASDQLPEGL